VSLYDEYQYNQLIKEPTQVTKSSKSLIDHVITTVPKRIRKSGVCHLSISDHNLIYAVRRMVMPRERPRIIQARNYKSFDLRQFRSNCSRNENVLKLRRHGVYDILKVKSQKKVGVTELVKKI
jgi:hypothetical protein